MAGREVVVPVPDGIDGPVDLTADRFLNMAFVMLDEAEDGYLDRVRSRHWFRCAGWVATDKQLDAMLDSMPRKSDVERMREQMGRERSGGAKKQLVEEQRVGKWTEKQLKSIAQKYSSHANCGLEELHEALQVLADGESTISKSTLLDLAQATKGQISEGDIEDTFRSLGIDLSAVTKGEKGLQTFPMAYSLLEGICRPPSIVDIKQRRDPSATSITNYKIKRTRTSVAEGGEKRQVPKPQAKRGAAAASPAAATGFGAAVSAAASPKAVASSGASGSSAAPAAASPKAVASSAAAVSAAGPPVTAVSSAASRPGVKKQVPDGGQRQIRYNELMDSPSGTKLLLAVIEFNVPGAKNGGTDKGADGHRVDSIPIANGVIKAGGACDIIKYLHDQHQEFEKQVLKYDAVIVRINPGQLSQGTSPGTQERFDKLMNDFIAKGKLVWSSPDVQTKMGAKDALVSINQLSCGLPDTLAYYTRAELEAGFKKNCAFQPRVIKQNRGSAGEGVWLCWLEGKEYCKTYGEKSLQDGDKLKLMEMNDNHVEYHNVREFLEFCINGPGGKAGEWKSTFPGKYLEGGKAAGGQIVDQRLCPRISEGEVRMLMVGDTLNQIIHKKPEGGLSAVGGNSVYTYYKPGDPKYADLEHKFLDEDLPQLKKAIGIEDQPLPILWTADFIPLDGNKPGSTVYTVGEFNCSCVGISKFQAVCGGEQTLADVSDEDYWETVPLTDLLGKKAIEMLEAYKKTGTASASSPGVDRTPSNRARSASPSPPPHAVESNRARAQSPQAKAKAEFPVMTTTASLKTGAESPQGTTGKSESSQPRPPSPSQTKTKEDSSSQEKGKAGAAAAKTADSKTPSRGNSPAPSQTKPKEEAPSHEKGKTETAAAKTGDNKTPSRGNSPAPSPTKPKEEVSSQEKGKTETTSPKTGDSKAASRGNSPAPASQEKGKAEATSPKTGDSKAASTGNSPAPASQEKGKTETVSAKPADTSKVASRGNSPPPSQTKPKEEASSPEKGKTEATSAKTGDGTKTPSRGNSPTPSQTKPKEEASSQEKGKAETAAAKTADSKTPSRGNSPAPSPTKPKEVPSQEKGKTEAAAAKTGDNKTPSRGNSPAPSPTKPKEEASSQEKGKPETVAPKVADNKAASRGNSPAPTSPSQEKGKTETAAAKTADSSKGASRSPSPPQTGAAKTADSSKVTPAGNSPPQSQSKPVDNSKTTSRSPSPAPKTTPAKK